MEPDDTPKIFKDMRFYFQAINHSKREELVLKLQSRGAIEVDRPNHPLCRAIFVFATNVQPYIIIGNGKARPLDTCLNEKTWTFHDLCTHFGRRQGDKEKRQGFVVDSSWADKCIERGAMVQRERWSGKEIMVKNKNGFETQTAIPPNPASSTPIESPATRQSTGTPALDVGERRDDTVDQVDGFTASAAPQSGPARAYQPPPIFASYGQSGESFHVFPHKGSVKLVATMNWFGGQVVDIEEADYIIVDRGSAHQVPPLKDKQHIIDSVWIDNSLELGQAQKIKDFIIIPGDIPNPSSVDNKPEVAPGALTPSQDHSFTTGRKRAATLSAPEPVAKIKRPGTPKVTQASLISTIRAPTSVTNHQDEATPVAYSLSGLFQIASEDDTPAQKASRKYYVDQVVKELDEWCDRDFEGTRNAFLISKRKDVNPEFDRVAFFSYNKKAIFRGLSRKGRDVGLGSELYEGARRSGKPNALESTSSDPSRPAQSGSSTLRGPVAFATPKSKRDSVPVAKPIASASVADTSSSREAAAPAISEALRSFFHPSGEIRRLGPLEAGAKQERQKLLLAYMIDELDQWCRKGSPGSRYAFLAGMNASSPLTFDRNRLFTDNKKAILQVLERRGRQVHKGTKIYGEPLKGPHKFVYNRRDGRETMISQSNPSFNEDSRDTASHIAHPPLPTTPRADPTAATTGSPPTTVAKMATSLSPAAPRRNRAYSVSNVSTVKKEKNLAQLIDELQVWCEGDSSESRSGYLGEMTVSKPGFDRISLYKRNRDYIHQALKERKVDVSAGSKIYGNVPVKDKSFTLRTRFTKQGEPKGPLRRASRASGSSHANDTLLTLAQPVFNVAAASSSHSSVPLKTVPAISRLDVFGLDSEPDASPYDVPLPFPVEEWVTDTRERIQGLSRTFRDLARS